MMMNKVKITIRAHHLTSSSGQYPTLFREVFSEYLPTNSGDVEVVLGLAKFGRFLIERDLRGISNAFKELAPVYYDEPQVIRPIRVYL